MSKTVEVQIVNMAFSPSTVEINVGDSVQWINQDAMTHTATADNGEFDSGDIQTNTSFTNPFQAPARVVKYHCEYHPGMRGTVKVT